MNYKYERAEIKNIIDGDTVDVDLDLGFEIHKNARLRLFGVDTPEIGETPRAKDAEEFFIQKSQENNNIASVEIIGKGPHGRYESILNFPNDSISFNKQIVKEGHLKEGFKPDPINIPEEYININKADSKRLTWLPNIGPSLSKKIIDLRNKRENITLKDLSDVNGIGDTTIEELVKFITH